MPDWVDFRPERAASKLEGADFRLIFSCMHVILHSALSVLPSVHPSIRPSIHRSVTLNFFWHSGGFWPHCSCPNALLTWSIPLAYPHMTGVALYPALLARESKFQAWTGWYQTLKQRFKLKDKGEEQTKGYLHRILFCSIRHRSFRAADQKRGKSREENWANKSQIS